MPLFIFLPPHLLTDASLPAGDNAEEGEIKNFDCIISFMLRWKMLES